MNHVIAVIVTWRLRQRFIAILVLWRMREEEWWFKVVKEVGWLNIMGTRYQQCVGNQIESPGGTKERQGSLSLDQIS